MPTARKFLREKQMQQLKLIRYHDIFRKTLLPITKMEKLMGKQGVAEILGSLIVKPVGKPTLTPSSDKRPVITNAK